MVGVVASRLCPSEVAQLNPKELLDGGKLSIRATQEVVVKCRMPSGSIAGEIDLVAIMEKS